MTETKYIATDIDTSIDYNYCVSDLGINIYGSIADVSEDEVIDVLVFCKCIEPHATHSDIAPGTYTIKITADTTEQGSVTETITLTVTDPTQPTIPDATLNPATPGNNGWYKEAYLVAPTGYTISDTENGTFAAQVSIANGTHTSIPYWLKSDSDSSVVAKTYIGTVNTDSVPPQRPSVAFDEITYNSAILSVTASDDLSGIAKYTLTCTNADGAAPIIGAFVPTNDGGTDSGTFTVTGMEPNTTYTFKIVVEDNAGNSFSMSGGEDLTVTTAKESLAGATVALKNGVSYTYDGLAKEPSVSDLTVTLNGNEIALNNTDYSISYANNTDAGNLANITITASDSNPTYTGAASGTFAIGKRTLTITASDQTINKGGAIAQGTSNVTYSETLADSSAAEHNLNAITLTADTATKKITASGAKIVRGANNEDVTANYNISYVPGTLTILDAGITITAKNSIVYDGAAVTIGTGTDNDITYTLTDCSNAEVAWYAKSDLVNALASAPSNAGTYVVKITANTVLGTTVNSTKEFEIQQLPLTATVQNQTLTYGDNPSVLINSVVYSGFVNGETDAVVSGAPVYSTNYVQYGDVTGTYTITASMENVVASNYNITVVPGSLTINPLPVTLSWSGHTGRTYGDGQEVTATVSNLLNNDAVQVTVENGNQTAVGTHTAKAVALTGAKAVNYTLTGTVTEQAYTIAKAAALTGISAEKKVRYTESTGELQLAELLLTNVGNPRITAATEKTDSNNILSGVTFTAGSISYTLGTLTNANVDDTAQIEVTVTSDTHEDITAAVTIQVVDKYVVDDKLTLTIADMPYGTSPAPAGSLTGTAQGQPVEVFTYKKQGEDAYQTLEALQNSSGYLPAGTYLVKYAYEDDEQIGTKTATFQVNPKALTVQVSVRGVTKEYDRTTTVSGTEQPQLIISGCVGSETAVLDNSNVVFQYADYNAGTNKTITASGIKLAAGEAVNENYTIADTASGAGAVIVPKNVTISPDKTYTKVYGSLDPAIAYQAEGLLTGDSISGSLKRVVGEKVGNYGYDVSGLTNGNYTIKLAEDASMFTITEAEATLTINSNVVTQKAGSQVKLTVTAQNKKELQAADTTHPATIFLEGVSFIAKGDGIFEGVYTIPADAKAGAQITLTVKTTDKNYKSDTVAELILTVSQGEKENLPTPTEVNGANFKLEMEKGITTVPETFKYNPLLNTVEKITTVLKQEILKQEVVADKTLVYDVTLQCSSDGGKTWDKADKDHWPASGKLTVLLPYPEGTGKDTHEFTVVHMFTTSDFGKTPGTTENPVVTKTDAGLQFQVTGLSPIMVGWKEIAAEDETPKDEPQQGQPQKPDSGNGGFGDAEEETESEENDAEESDTEKNTGKIKDNVPNTGDSSQLELWIAFMIVLLSVGVVILFNKKSGNYK
ncbi:MAG: hypothetical protein J6A94_03830 [Lachnospiraceae bacterium]|nr:hypothetical protein [Lachnospiraceae bacterium]